MANYSSMNRTIIGDALPNIPWEDKPAGYEGVLLRYIKNPLI